MELGKFATVSRQIGRRNSEKFAAWKQWWVLMA